MTAARLGVGIIGCGPVTQTIHLPVLATMPDRFRVAHVMDVDGEVASAVAERVNARHTTNVEELLSDPDVDVVAICSPHGFHAEQVQASCEAGKRAVLCEKPLAVDRAEAQEIVAASRATGVPVVVGTMHVYDAAVRAALREWTGEAELVRSVITLPPNERFIDAAAQLHAEPAPMPASSGPGSPSAGAGRFMGAILGLATHNLPLVRRFAPEINRVVVARILAPIGYEIVFTSGNTTVQLLATFHQEWKPDWRLDVWAREQTLRLQFPPSYVLAGSATATLLAGTPERRWRLAENGYQAEWRHLGDLAAGKQAPIVDIADAATDLDYALSLAERCGNLVMGGK